MAIGQDEAVGGEDESGASALSLPGLAGTVAACCLMYFDVHDGRGNSFDGAGDGG